MPPPRPLPQSSLVFALLLALIAGTVNGRGIRRERLEPLAASDPGPGTDVSASGGIQSNAVSICEIFRGVPPSIRLLNDVGSDSMNLWLNGHVVGKHLVSTWTVSSVTEIDWAVPKYGRELTVHDEGCRINGIDISVRTGDFYDQTFSLSFRFSRLSGDMANALDSWEGARVTVEGTVVEAWADPNRVYLRMADSRLRLAPRPPASPPPKPALPLPVRLYASNRCRGQVALDEWLDREGKTTTAAQWNMKEEAIRAQLATVFQPGSRRVTWVGVVSEVQAATWYPENLQRFLPRNCLDLDRTLRSVPGAVIALDCGRERAGYVVYCVTVDPSICESDRAKAWPNARVDSLVTSVNKGDVVFVEGHVIARETVPRSYDGGGPVDPFPQSCIYMDRINVLGPEDAGGRRTAPLIAAADSANVADSIRIATWPPNVEVDTLADSVATPGTPATGVEGEKRTH